MDERLLQFARDMRAALEWDDSLEDIVKAIGVAVDERDRLIVAADFIEAMTRLALSMTSVERRAFFVALEDTRAAITKAAGDVTEASPGHATTEASHEGEHHERS